MCIYVVVPNIIPLEPMGLLRYQFQSFTTNVWGVFLSTGSLQSLPLQKSFSKAQLSHESGDVHLEKKNIHSSPQKRTNLPTIPSRKRFVSSKLQKTTDFFDHQKGWTDLKMMFSLKKNGKKNLGSTPRPGMPVTTGIVITPTVFFTICFLKIWSKKLPFFGYANFDLKKWPVLEVNHTRISPDSKW